MSVINTNVKALTAQGSLSAVNDKISKSMQRLSTGLRINSAKDDAAGLAITNKMTSDIRGLTVAIRNANDGLSLAQTAEGAISQINDMLQRMRELAVQASNGTSSDLARKGSQQEIDQLKQEINNISARTAFNGIRLLDGSSSNLVLQTGSEVGQTIGLNLDSVNTSTIGIGSRASLSAGGFTDTAANLVANKTLASGDIIINGVMIGGSSATSDTLSKEAKSASAIAKAAAINALSKETGVTAVVNQTYMSGVAMVNTNTHAGRLAINGVKTADISVTAGNDMGVVRKAVADAINAISAQTGVVAKDSGDVANGVILTAADGRNITVETAATVAGAASTLVAADVGLQIAVVPTDKTTATGTFSLQSTTGAPIVLTSSASGDITRAGLSSGTFVANQSILTTSARAVGANGAGATAAGQMNSGTLKINGVAISGPDPSDDKASDVSSDSSSKSYSAIAIAAAINKSSSLTGVTAKASANLIAGGTDAATNWDNTVSIASKTLWVNGVGITFESYTTGYSRQDIANAINAATGQTGVVATDNGATLDLTAADGRNITLGSDTNAKSFGLVQAKVATGATDAATGKTTYAKVELISDKQFTVLAGSEGSAGKNFELLGFKEGTFGGESNGFKVSDVDISTQSGAQASLKALDAALETVNFSQSKIGAFQNRLDSAIANLTEVSRNTSESRSRILDADYAVETTNLAKSQIIQQAATAMLAQANQSAQSVLSLLK